MAALLITELFLWETFLRQRSINWDIKILISVSLCSAATKVSGTWWMIKRILRRNFVSQRDFVGDSGVPKGILRRTYGVGLTNDGKKSALYSCLSMLTASRLMVNPLI